MHVAQLKLRSLRAALAAACVTLALAGLVSAQDTTKPSDPPQHDPPPQHDKKPLDLPTGGGALDDAAPAETVHFCGSEYEANAFFWCVDTSGSMTGARLRTLQGELCASLELLSPQAEFSLVAFATAVSCFSDKPLPATAENIARAKEWVNALSAGGWTCMPEGLVKTIEVANQSKFEDRIVILAGDGVPSCGAGDGTEKVDLAAETLEDVKIANYAKIKIHTVLLGGGRSDDAAGKFFATLSSAHKGKFTQVR